MRRRKDETGNKYGELTVQRFAHSRNRQAHWVCLCSCGRESVVSGVNLRSGNSTKCQKCKSKNRDKETMRESAKNMQGRPLIDFTNKRFGKVEVLEKGSIKERDGSATKTVYWKVRCDCGKEYEVQHSQLAVWNKDPKKVHMCRDCYHKSRRKS